MHKTNETPSPDGQGAKRLVIIGGSDAGTMAALRARELDATVDVTMVVADSYPNFSVCGQIRRPLKHAVPGLNAVAGGEDDVFATAHFHGMPVDGLNDLDLSYTPPMGAPWDAVQEAAQTWLAEARRPS